MKTWTWAALVVAALACHGHAIAADPTYWQDVRPVLRKYCTVCHSAKNVKELDVSGGLALDSYEAVLKGSKQPVLRAGKSADSLLIKLVTTEDADNRMPLGARPVPPEVVDLFRRWIDAGAKEGQKPVGEEGVGTGGTALPTRKLDVVLPTGVVPPQGVFGPGAPAKLELVLKAGPLAPVAAVAFSPDGKLLAVGSYGRVTVWELAAVRPVQVLTNVLGAVNDVRFSPDGKLLAVAGGQPSAKGDLRLYQVAGWKLVGTLPGHEDVVFGVAFSPDGKLLASASFDKTVRIWDVAGHKAERVLAGHSDFVYAVAFGPDGKWVASASKDRTVKIVEVETGKSLFTLSGMDQDVLAVAVSPDGGSVVSSGFESGLYWWNAKTGQRVRVQGGHGVAVHELCFSKDGQTVASAGADRTVRLWNGSTGAPGKVLSVGSLTYAVAVSPDGKLVASGSFDGLVRLWDVGTGKQRASLLALPGQGDKPDWLALAGDGYLASSEALATLGQWRMAGKPVDNDLVWKALANPELLAKAARGEPVTSPSFAK